MAVMETHYFWWKSRIRNVVPKVLHARLDLSLNFFLHTVWWAVQFCWEPPHSRLLTLHSPTWEVWTTGSLIVWTFPVEDNPIISHCFCEDPELSPSQEQDLPSAAQTVYVRQTAVPVSQEALSFLPAASLNRKERERGSIDVICFLASTILWCRWSMGLMLS